MGNIKDLTGQRFGRLVVEEYSHSQSYPGRTGSSFKPYCSIYMTFKIKSYNKHTFFVIIECDSNIVTWFTIDLLPLELIIIKEKRGVQFVK